MVQKYQAEAPLSNRIENFQELMKFKVREILLVSSLYDFYLFEEDGRLYELIREEYQILNLSQAPEITHVTTAQEAFEKMEEGRYDIIISTLHVEDMHVITFADLIRKKGILNPIIILAYDNKERKELVSTYNTSNIDRIFIWQGDYRLIMGIIKYVEDKMNVESDTNTVGVQSIIVVEDNVKFYSSYLPLIYTEIFNQSQRLISEGINLSHRFLRMRARPKILLATNYEEAWEYYEKYKDYILGIILDINFRKGGVKDPEAGIKFAKAVKEQHQDIPLLLQSSNRKYEAVAKSINTAFLYKHSPRLLYDLQEFMLNNFGFGDFVFMDQNKNEIGRAHNLTSLEEQLRIVPEESILYHSERNHFSNWLKARTEFWLAHRLRPRKVSEFRTVDELRAILINSIRQYKEVIQRGVITDFNKETFDPQNSFARIGGGSLGGKARGLGFVNKMINTFNVRHKFDNVEILVPSGIVIATDVFDKFLLDNNLECFSLIEMTDEEIAHKFSDANVFRPDVIEKLRDFLSFVKEPLAVRSSSLLEDSQFQPFAGVYETYMLPNNGNDDEKRLKELLDSIKSVYASTFFKRAKDYIKITDYRLEEEKMAVIIQKLIGTQHEDRFYPDFAGVAKSYNFYPAPPQKSTDGIALVALGLGKTVVEGGNSLRFCPKYPKHLLQFTSTKETVKNSQQKFFALNLKGNFEFDFTEPEVDHLVDSFTLDVAEKDKTLNYVGSTFSPENDAIYDGVSRPGRRIVTLAPILKHKVFPLAEVLSSLLEIGTWGMGTPVELEFAVNMNVPAGDRKQFGLLQMRPLVLSHELEELNIKVKDKNDLVCESNQVMGNGHIKDIHDVVVVDINKFDRGKSHLTAVEVSKINSKLVNERKPYVLIGVGRWGSMDQWLGIPVTWDQINGAAVIVETGFKDFIVTPSQGSHFFQNITSFRIGYFTVNAQDHKSFIDWDWLNEQKPEEEFVYTKHLRFEQPLTVKINAHQNLGVILKPGK